VRPGQIGGLLLIGGCVAFLAALGLASTGGAVGLGVIGVSGTLVLVALLLGGFGCAAIAVQAPPPVCGPWIRASMGAVAGGLLCLCLGSAIASFSTGDPLASLPFVALTGLGLVATVIGVAATGATLVVAPWSPRWPGVLILAGFLCLAASVFVLSGADDSGGSIRGLVATVGFVGILIGGIWIGVTAFRGEGSPAVA
jgi:hypothetical protein